MSVNVWKAGTHEVLTAFLGARQRGRFDFRKHTASATRPFKLMSTALPPKRVRPNYNTLLGDIRRVWENSLTVAFLYACRISPKNVTCSLYTLQYELDARILHNLQSSRLETCTPYACSRKLCTSNKRRQGAAYAT